MTDQSADQEPSIEEILASIRQIISDDEEEGGDAAPEEAAAPAPEPEPEPEPDPDPAPEAEAEAEEDILELTEEIEDVQPEPAPLPEPEPLVEMDMVETPSIISDKAASEALGSLSKLTGNMPIARREGYSGVTVEDIVRELLNPMLREWVDDNLPPLVERLVQKELEKLARRALDDQ